jgi:hypothetical protein
VDGSGEENRVTRASLRRVQRAQLAEARRGKGPAPLVGVARLFAIREAIASVNIDRGPGALRTHFVGDECPGGHRGPEATE